MHRTAMLLALSLGPAHANPLANPSQLLERLAPTTCPAGMVLAGVAGTETAFCIEANQRSGAYYLTAQRACMAEGRHLCTSVQWYVGALTSGVNNMCNGDWEWTGTTEAAHTSGHLHVIMGGSACDHKSREWSGFGNNQSSRAYRCCLGGLSNLFE